MIDLACIFTTGGVVLFCKAFCDLKFDILDKLIKKVLIEVISDVLYEAFLKSTVISWIP
jgi:hypothetical protein